MTSPAAPADLAAARPPRFAALLSRLVLAGLLAGALSGGWSLLITEPALAPALAIEEARSAASATGSPDGVFGRSMTIVGGVLGVVLAGLLLAVVLAAVFAGVRHRLPARTDFGRMVLLATIGFAVVGILPAVKVPANPPAVGDPNTVGTRTAIYGAVLAGGLVVVLLVAALVSALRSRGVATPATTLAAVLATAIGAALIMTLLPDSPDRIPSDVPAAVVWNFRLASLGQLAVLWATLGLAGGALVDRLGHVRS